jgi:hypothetical protein
MRTPSAGTRLARLEERLAEARRVYAGEDRPVIAYADDDEGSLKAYVAQRESMGAELLVVVRSLAPRPNDTPPPWA